MRVRIPSSFRSLAKAIEFWENVPKGQRTKANARRVANVVGYRSMAEVKFAADLKAKKIKFDYEPEKFQYIPPAKNYTPDFRIKKRKRSGGYMYIEFKGNFKGSDRTKMLLVKRDHPEMDLRLVFMKADNRLNRNSKTTYAKWCDKNGFKWADGGVLPDAWAKE